MTKANVKNFLHKNIEFQEIVMKIIEELDGVSVSDSKKVLDCVNYFLQENTLIDAATTKSLIDDSIEGDINEE